MNAVRLFATLFCGCVALQVACHFSDQHRYVRLLPPGEETAWLLGRWRVPRLSPRTFLLCGALLMGGLGLAAASWNPWVTRLSLVGALATYFLYFGQIASLGYVQRKTHLLPLVLSVLLLAPGTTGDWHAPAPVWPLILVQALLAQVYMVSGLTKLRRAGWSWADGRSLQSFLLASSLTYDTQAAWDLGRRAGVCRAVSAAILTFELAGFVLLLLPGLSWLFAAAGLAFHLGALRLMRIDYLTYHGPVFLVFAAEPLAAVLAGG